MYPQSTVRIALCATLLALAGSALAHDAHEHEAPKEKPTTCDQLADRTRYSGDLSDPQIKALKETCDKAKTHKNAKKDEG
jgi:hypothetical protein